jgi:ATP-dependent Clp protease ATP-binding subunit ClpX
MEHVDLEFTEKALSEIAELAIKRKTGARGLRTILEKILLNTMYELPSLQNASKIVIDERVVLNNVEPLIVYETKIEANQVESEIETELKAESKKIASVK